MYGPIFGSFAKFTIGNQATTTNNITATIKLYKEPLFVSTSGNVTAELTFGGNPSSTNNALYVSIVPMYRVDGAVISANVGTTAITLTAPVQARYTFRAEAVSGTSPERLYWNEGSTISTPSALYFNITNDDWNQNFFKTIAF